MQIDRDSAGIRIPPPAMFIGTFVVGLLLGKLLGDPDIPMWSTKSFGWFAVVAGGAIMLTAIGLFRKAGTHARPWKRSTSLVTDGVFRWTRNPMYLGMALIYAGCALMFDSLVALLLLIPLVYVIQREVIQREERYMEARFGAAYREYKASVRRWI